MPSSQRGKSTIESEASAPVSQPGFANGHRALISGFSELVFSQYLVHYDSLR